MPEALRALIAAFGGQGRGLPWRASDERIDEPNRIVRANVVVYCIWK